ncbi:MAG: hypothetical protein IT356_01485 [Gemmatimonadaceae bacterium]|nr:hypothetical protein [Gemmatimonadaceae bacterium]
MATSAVAVRSTSILTPVVDFLLVGGLSMIIFIPILASGQEITWVTIGTVAWIQLIVNYAHFLGSFRIVYRSKEMILRHKWATIGVPLIMAVCLVYALYEARTGSQFMLAMFFMVASGYLAWHYTGQTWGMMVVFAHLNGIRHTRLEYWLIRGGLRILLVWHLMWFLKVTLANPALVEAAFQVTSYLTIAAFVMGAAGLIHIRMRTGKNPPFRGVVAWVALFVWYAFIARYGLMGLFLVQLAHALQYLEFPLRVEINRAAQQTIRSQGTQLALYVLGMLGTTVLITLFVPGPTKAVASHLLGAGPESVAPVLISYYIAIHHFFADGVIWKLRNPDVQEDLFAHARPVANTAEGAAPMWWQRAFWVK